MSSPDVTAALRRTDPAAQQAWAEREHARLHRCEQVMTRLHAEGELPEGAVPTAARLMWALTSQHAWEDLVIDQGWSATEYTHHITALLESALLKPQPA